MFVVQTKKRAYSSNSFFKKYEINSQREVDQKSQTSFLT